MPTETFNFDLPTSRLGSGSYKWDEHPGPVPMWVADMDFETAPCVIEALRRRVDHGIFGYTLVTDAYYEALTGWFASRHGFSFGRGDVIYTSGVVPAISAIIKALVRPGDGVIVQTPVYNCFFSSIRNNGCRIVENPLVREDTAEGEFTYRMDFDGLERLCADHANTMLILCNPANPAGRLWTADELTRLRDITARNGVRVVSDEIHCELTPPDTTYTPYGPIDPEAIVCLSPSKAFNTAGLQIANIVCRDEASRALIDRAININEVCDVNPFGVEGLKAAYSPEGAAWLDALRRYLHSNWLAARDIL
ncbi:MAG: aminotransferase class I/II-fold pyridoxal phosphate-dependent enzyme, partial [Duncaniella sp.]|nr:aminotransferase class I/II-fold pyridoxal phosphate-dependent enzyme [Duncaniella sp.]